MNRPGLTPLESSAISSRSDIDEISIPHRKGMVKAPFFLTGLTRTFSLFLIVFIVGIIAYWVIQASLPTEGPRVSFLFRDGEPYAEISIPYPCTETFRIFRSADGGASWDRVLSPAHGGDLKECLLYDPLKGIPQSTVSLQYRYSRIDTARDISYLSHASLLRLLRTPLESFAF